MVRVLTGWDFPNPEKPEQPRFYVGLDLGQAQDFTALAVMQAIAPQKPLPRKEKPSYHVRHLERLKLGTPYPEVARYVKDMLGRHQLRGIQDLIVDATGVGRPVVDMLRSYGLKVRAVTITGGNSVTVDSIGYRVPKRDLVMALLVLLQGERIKFAEGLPEVPTLIKELLAFEVKITDSAHDTYGAWREGAHDDLVLAVALAAWYAERFGSRKREARVINRG